MPRGPRKTQAGAPAQTGPGVAGQTYGNRPEQQALEAVAPTPNFAAQQPADPAVAAGGAGQPTAPGTAANSGADRYQAAIAAAQQLAQHTGALTRPTSRPNEPVTTGLTQGPGAGPEALEAGESRLARQLRSLSVATGDPTWAELANRAGL